MIATLLLSTLLLTGDGAADSVLVRYDLSGVLTTFDSNEPLESLMMSAGTFHERHRTSLEDLYDTADANSVVELLARLFGEEFEYEGRELHLQDDRELLVLAPDDVQQRVQAALAELERTFAGTVELQIDILSLPADAPAPFGGRSVVDEAQLSGLPSDGRPHERYQIELQAGRTSAVQRMRELPLIVDYNVEIAQGSVIHDPAVGSAEAGTRILLRGAPTSGGLGLSVLMLHGTPLQEEPTPIDAPLSSYVSTDPDQTERYIEAPSLQERYEIASRGAAFDTLLPPGKALVISSAMDVATLDPEGGRNREVVVIRRTSGEMQRMHRFSPQGSRRELVFVNAESLRAPSIATHNELRPRDDDDTSEISALAASITSEPSVFLVDWVDDRFSTWRMIGPWLVCVYDASWDGDAVATLAAMMDGWQDRERLLELQVFGIARGEVAASWSLPVRAGSRLAAMAGISTSTLAEYDVEVAQGAAAADPQVRPQFAGLAFRARTGDLAEGGASVELAAMLRHRPQPPRSATLGGPLMTKLERTPFDVLMIDERVSFAAGGLGGVGGTRDLGDRGGLQGLRIQLR